MKGVFDKKVFTEPVCKLLGELACLNSNATPTFTSGEDGSLSVEQFGNKTECALLELAYKLGYDYRKFRGKDKILATFPFSSLTKSMSVIVRDETKT